MMGHYVQIKPQNPNFKCVPKNMGRIILQRSLPSGTFARAITGSNDPVNFFINDSWTA